MDSLVYTNKANANNYVLREMFRNFPDNLLTLHTHYGELSTDFFSTFRINTDKEVVLVQNQVEMWDENLCETQKMLRKLLCMRFTP